MLKTRTHEIGLLLLLAALAGGALPARAQVAATVSAYNGQDCAGTRSAANLNCTSNDFTTSASFTQPPPGLPSCIAGGTYFLDLIAVITSHAPNRWDGAIFTGEVGNDPSKNTPASPTQTCSLGMFPTSPSPFLNDDGDACGDFLSGSTAALTVQNVKVYCQPAPGTNVLGVPYMLVFDNQSNPGCTAATVTANTKAKCVASTTAQVTGVIVQGYVQLTQQTNPVAQPQSFPFTTSGTASANPSSFSLTAGNTQVIQVPLSPTGGTQTLQIDQTAVAGWKSTATITCTTPAGGAAAYVTVDNVNRRITATLDPTNFGAVCTITDEKLATVKIVEQTNGGTGAFAFSGGTNGLPALNLDTGTGNPASSTAYVVTANNVAAAITQTIPAGWTLASASCTDGAVSFGTRAGSTLSIAAGDVLPGRNITCTFSNTKNARLTKAFTPTSVGAGKPSTLTFTITNSTGNPAQSGMGFTDTFPANLAVASPLTVSNTCGGTLYRGGTVTPLASGDPSLKLSGGALTAGVASCTIGVAVASSTVATYTNGAGQITSVAGGLDSGVTDQSLTVYALPNLLLVKSADRATAKPGDVITYTLVVQNTGAGVATNVVLTDPISNLVWWSVNAYGAGVSFQFTDGSPSSGLTLGTPVYSSDGGSTWTLAPASGGGSAPVDYDSRVTNWKIPMTGSMAAGRQFTLTFKVAVR